MQTKRNKIIVLTQFEKSVNLSLHHTTVLYYIHVLKGITDWVSKRNRATVKKLMLEMKSIYFDFSFARYLALWEHKSFLYPLAQYPPFIVHVCSLHINSVFVF